MYCSPRSDISNYFERQAGNSTKYYYAGATRVALRQGANPPQFLLGDHLGSATRTASAAGATSGMQLYRPWGETRHASGSLLTQYQYTGQWKSASGLYWYNSRWYDSALGRFVQPDTLIPEAAQGTQAWDRYAYVNNSPVNFNDPTGHDLEQILFNKRGWLRPDIREKQSNGPVSWSDAPSYATFSLGVDVPSLAMGAGAILLPFAPEVGGTVLLAGVVVEGAAYAGHPLCLLIKAISVGANVTVDAYGNIYIGPDISIGKAATPIIAGGLTTGHIITPDQLFPSSEVTQNFLSGFAVSANLGIGPGVTAMSAIPSGVAWSPMANVPFAKTGVIFQTTIASFDASYSWNVGNISNTTTPWGFIK